MATQWGIIRTTHTHTHTHTLLRWLSSERPQHFSPHYFPLVFPTISHFSVFSFAPTGLSPVALIAAPKY